MPIYQERRKNKLPKNGNSWYFRCYYTDMFGNRKQKMSKKFLTKKEATIAEREFLEKIEMVDETDLNISFENMYNDWWEVKKTQIKKTTRYSLKKKIDKHILLWFKPYKLHSIKWNILNEWREDLFKKYITDEYKNSIIGYMKEVLDFAVNHYDYDKKVASKLQKQRIDKRKDKINDAEINFWTLNEFKTFIKVVDNELDNLMYDFLYYTGLRLGEMIALTWNDIDLDKKKLKIDKTFTNKVDDDIFAILDPKTSNSFRIIDLDDKLVERLKKYKSNEMKIYGFNNKMYVFGNVNYIAPTSFARHLNNWIDKAGIKRITPHGFRHSHASLLIYLGCDSRDVADRLGDTVEVIERTYAHLFPEKRSITINRINNLKK